MSIVQIREEGPNYATKALVDFLSPLISNAIQQQQQRDTNRKNNAFLGEFAKLMNGGQQPTNLLTEQGSNGWENAFNQSVNSALSQFDANTAGIAPQTTVQANFSQPQMTQTDLLQNFINFISSKRFSGMNTADALSMVAPYMNAAEAQRVYELQKELGLNLNNAKDWDNYIKILANGAIQKLTDLDTLKLLSTHAASRITQDRPQPFTVDYGGGYQQGVYDPVLSQFINQNDIKKTLSPQDIVAGDHWDKEFGFKQQEWRDQREDNRYAIDTQANLEREKIDANKNRQGTMFAGGDGKLYIQNPDGSIEKVIVDGEHIDAPEGLKGTTWTPGDTAMMADMSQQITEISNRIAQLENEYNETTDKQKEAYLRQQIETLKQQREQLRQQMRDFLQSRTGRRSNSQSQQEQATPPTQPQPQNEGNNTENSPSTTQNNSSAEKPRDDSPIIWRNRKTGRAISQTVYEDLKRQAVRGELVDNHGVRNLKELDEFLRKQGYTRGPITRQEEIKVLQQSGFSEADIRAMYPDYNKIMSDNNDNDNNLEPVNQDRITEQQTPQEETGMGPFMTEKEKQEVDKILRNPDKLESKPVPQDIQANNPNTLNRSRMQLAANRSNSTINNPFPDAPEGSYTLEERIAEAADDFARTEIYDELFGDKDPHIFTNDTAGIQPITSPDAKYKPKDIIEQSQKNLRNPESWQGIVDSAKAEREATNHWEPAEPMDPKKNLDYLYMNEEYDNNNPNEVYQFASNRRRRKQVPQRQVVSGTPNATAQQINRRAARFENIINSASRRYGVPPELIKAVIMTESSFNPNASNSIGAKGLMQLMPKTARSLGVRDALDPAQNIEGGTKYLAQMLRMFKGDVRKALWAYNAGPGNAKKGRLPKETRAYIPRAMGFYNALRGVSPTPARRTPIRRNTRTRLANNPSVTPTEQTSLNNLNGYRRANDMNTQMQDNSPIAWQNANGQAALTQNTYEELVNRAERGEINGFISREDVDEYLSKTRGLKNVAQTPAPEYTEAVNKTTAVDMQKLIDELNGIVDDRHKNYTQAIQRAAKNFDETIKRLFPDYQYDGNAPIDTRPYDPYAEDDFPNSPDYDYYPGNDWVYRFTPEEQAMARILTPEEFNKWLFNRKGNPTFYEQSN